MKGGKYDKNELTLMWDFSVKVGVHFLVQGGDRWQEQVPH